LIPGCGNSDLSEKICTKLGLDGISVDSFDYEETIVKEMQEKSPKDLNLVFRVGDATNLSSVYQDGQFHVAVDKGTLDAIAVNSKEETIANCNAYFNEMIRVLDSK
jgi:ubiquinone/menaquinone biosynthesis C-methylase UbiE